jgi:hypothetical protein
MLSKGIYTYTCMHAQVRKQSLQNLYSLWCLMVVNRPAATDYMWKAVLTSRDCSQAVNCVVTNEAVTDHTADGWRRSSHAVGQSTGMQSSRGKSNRGHHVGLMATHRHSCLFQININVHPCLLSKLYGAPHRADWAMMHEQSGTSDVLTSTAIYISINFLPVECTFVTLEPQISGCWMERFVKLIAGIQMLSPSDR